MKKDKYDRSNYYNKTNLKELGFSETMIKNLAGDPELERPNPLYHSAAPIKLWSKEHIDTLMKTDEFKIAIKKKAVRSTAAKKVAKAKKAATEEFLQTMINQFEVYRPKGYSYNNVLHDAVDDWNKQNAGHYDERINDVIEKANPTDVDKETKERWAVNYIRHQYSNYDSLESGWRKLVRESKGKVGNWGIFSRYKKAILDKIAEVWPELADACAAQGAAFVEMSQREAYELFDAHHGFVHVHKD